MKARTMRKIDWCLALLAVGLLAAGAQRVFSVDSGPQLRIGGTTNSLRLSWPASARDWMLEHAAELNNAASWTALSAVQQSNSTEIYVNLPRPAVNRFYRLRKLAPVVSSLTGHWQFDGADESVTLNNTVSGVGRVGTGALAFGNDSWASISNSNYRVLPGSAQPFSVSLCFNLAESYSDWSSIIGNEVDGWHVALYTPSVGTNYIVFAGSGLEVRGRALLLPGQWYELTVTYDGNEGRVYLDGNLLGQGSGNLITHDGPIYLGGRIGNFSGFAGRLDELRTYTEALSAEQLSLCGHWSFDENAGGLALDRSIHGHHGRLSNDTWQAQGKTGSAIRTFSNVVTIANDYLTVLPRTAGPFSVSFWMQPHSPPAGHSSLMSCRDGTNGGWDLTLQTDTICFESTNAGGTLSLRAPANLIANTWTKVDLTYNGGIATLYLNGRKVHQESGAIVGSRAPLVVGNFNGAIDELKIYRRERAAFEIGPVAAVTWETVMLNGTTNLPLQGAGPLGKTLTYAILNAITPTNGTITQPDASGVIRYSAGARKGPDAFVYTVSDGEFTSIPATVAISVVQPHWLAPEGGSLPPLDGSSPERAWSAGSDTALDAIWKTNNYYDCFYYAPGTYHTTGCRYDARATIFPGCKHIGSGSEGSNRTILKLVKALDPYYDETLFGIRYSWEFIDGFEAHNMVLDGNAAGNPKFTRGIPVWLRVPLTATSHVQSVGLRWNNELAFGWYRFGRAAEFSVCARTAGINGYVTNCVSGSPASSVDTVPINADTDELMVQLELRDTNVQFYSLGEVEVNGATVSLPKALTPGGTDSRLEPGNTQYSIFHVVDNNPGTYWASGVETNVEIFLPLDPGTTITHLDLHWHCWTFTNGLQLGPAAEYRIRARNPATGLYEDVAFTRGARTPDGHELNTFAAPVVTDHLMLVLDNKEPTTHVYSLREITTQHDWRAVRFRVPSALNTFPWGDYTAMRAFDGAPESAWACTTQGAITAVTALGNNLKFTGLKIMGFGTKGFRECFAMSVYNTTFTPLGNVLVEDCLFTEPATGNGDGLSVVTVTGRGGNLTNAIVRRCTVRDVRSDFSYSHGFGANHVENCVVENCGEAMYFEPDFNTDYLGTILVRSNRFENVNNGIFVNFHPGRQFGSVIMLDNEVALAPGSGYALSACDICGPGESGSITNVTAVNNLVRYADWQPRWGGREGGFLYSDIHHGVYANNVVALGTFNGLRVRHCPAGSFREPDPPQLCAPHLSPALTPGLPNPPYPPCVNELLPGYRRAWSNNRDLSGALLEVRFHNFGVDGPALQQQMP